ncbi:hypothetical protein ACFV6E_21075 [Streptomyces sp. NPDC059785]|uniref:hypothetical protein n=1 Tax=Streptomyces sp. NPDC059785 TaxID=3346945 RepID=UPI003663C81C
MPELDRIETRVMAVGALALQGAVHVLCRGDESAARHAEHMQKVLAHLGRRVGRLSAGDTDDVRRAAYRADVVVGTVDDFIADLGRESELGITRHTAMVEGGPDGTPSALLRTYRKVVPA